MSDIRSGDRVSDKKRPSVYGEVDYVKGQFAKVYWDRVDIYSRKHHAAGNVTWSKLSDLRRHNSRR